jgi:hypothetical protein
MENFDLLVENFINPFYNQLLPSCLSSEQEYNED